MTVNKAPLVTIGIPSYNRADSYLKQAVLSAVNQTYPNIEIIISDNCSLDNTEEVIRGINDPRIRYFKQSNNIGGLNNANFCVEQAKGDYFLLLHDDDLIDYDFISVCMEAVNYDVNYGIILTGTRVIDSGGRIIGEAENKVVGLSTKDFFMGWFDNKLPIYLCSTLFNTRRLKEMGCFRSLKNLHEDSVALFQLAAKFGRKDVRDVKASFRRHSENSGSSASISDWCDDALYLLNIMCGLVQDDQGIVKSRGMHYFSVQNYNRAARIQSPLKRLYAYYVVYRAFEYSYSPVRYLLKRNFIYSVMVSLKRKYMTN